MPGRQVDVVGGSDVREEGQEKNGKDVLIM